MVNNKRIIKWSVLGIIIILIIMAVIIKYDLFYKSSIEELNLTTEQKLEDFEQFYTIITTSFANLEEVEKAYGFDFEEKCDGYRKMIEESEDDYEFFSILAGIIGELGSFHTDLVFPEMESIKKINCYNAENVIENKKFQVHMDYWYNLIGEQCKAREHINTAGFRYINGVYYYDSNWSDEVFQDYINYYVVSIDDCDVDRYITENLFLYGLHYDMAHGKAFRNILIFNGSEGKKVRLKLQNDAGDVRDAELFWSIEQEAVEGYGGNYEQETNGGTKESIYHYYDQTEDLLYVEMKNFSNNEGKKIKNIFKQAGDNTRIIIDLRRNYGGNPYYVQDYIYPYLYDEDVVYERYFLMPITKYNAEQNNRLANKLLYGTHRLEDNVVYHNKIKYKGGSQSFKENLYFIVGENTGSAADNFASLIKEFDLGTVVGVDTGGEGFGSSYFLYTLENSQLPVVYFPASPYQADTVNNAVYGTSPDVYIFQDKEGFYKRCDMRNQGIDVYTYENRLLWDNVLVETMRMGKE